MDWGLILAAAGVLTGIAVPGTIWWLDRRRQARATDSLEFSIEGAEWVLESGLTYEALLQRLISLDHAALAELDDRTEGNAIQWAPVFAKSPETWSLVVFRNKVVVGYWSFFSLSPKLVGHLKAGKLFDSKINAASVRRITEPGPHSLYFVMLARHADFSSTGGVIFQLLMQSLAHSLDRLIADGTEVSVVYADAVSAEGRALCESLGFKCIAPSVQGGAIFETTVTPELLKRLRRFGERGQKFLSRRRPTR